MRTLRTQRLRLAPVSVHNARALWHVLQAPALRDFQDLPSAGMEEFSVMVSKRPKTLRAGSSGRFEWLVYLHGGRTPLGWLSLRVSERGLRAGEIGYSIMREHRGRGFATEAVAALVGEAFTQGELERISAYCVPQNAASRHVLDRLGFRDAGLVRHGASVGGRPVDVLHHVMEHGEWHRRQSANSMEMPASAYP